MDYQKLIFSHIAKNFPHFNENNIKENLPPNQYLSQDPQKLIEQIAQYLPKPSNPQEIKKMLSNSSLHQERKIQNKLKSLRGLDIYKEIMEFDPTLDLKHMDQKTLEEKYKQIKSDSLVLKEQKQNQGIDIECEQTNHQEHESSFTQDIEKSEFTMFSSPKCPPIQSNFKATPMSLKLLKQQTQKPINLDFNNIRNYLDDNDNGFMYQEQNSYYRDIDMSHNHIFFDYN